MIERFISMTLKAGLAAIAKDPTILDLLFGDELELTKDEVKAVKKFFALKPPQVLIGYPRSDSQYPLYCITLGSEGEKNNVIGDEGTMDEDEDSETYGADEKVALWSHRYNIFCMTEHPDATTYIYEVAKQTLFVNATGFFRDNGLWGINISGMDLAPDPRYIPANIYARQLSFACEREFNVVDARSKLGKAFKVDGIYVDKSGSPSDVGGVKTLVTVKDE